jgi:uncharacterized protein YjbI with pentapeptide repeats
VYLEGKGRQAVPRNKERTIIMAVTTLRYTRISKEDFDDIIARHNKWLNKEPGGKEADFYGISLSGLDLSNYQFVKVNFRYSICWQTKFTNAYFKKCNFYKSNIYGADFTNACFYEVNCKRASMSSSDFTGAKIRHSKFKEANLQCVLFRNTLMSSCDCTDASFYNANITKSRFLRTKTDNADFGHDPR